MREEIDQLKSVRPLGTIIDDVWRGIAGRLPQITDLLG
jgi:hypothetical protein